MKIRTLFMATAIAAASYAAPAFATSCAVGDITPTAIACEGRFTGNVLSNNAGDITIQKNALALLGYAWDGTGFGTLPKLSPLGGVSSIDFPGVLSGITYVGIHVGGKGGGTTSFYKFDAGTSLDAFTLNLPSSSAAVLYLTGTPDTGSVPEPASWALMLGGFGMIGGALRSHKKSAVSFG
jgi:hypothetical protein